jgi:2-polyprenyl-3-methyl-5-hydroxy-6-metoxy-1,4-benzoquinol methylase
MGNYFMIDSLNYTGERMVPEKSGEYTFWEHIYRYRFAAAFVKNKRVLDIACGEGYGMAALMRSGAATVIGVDVSPEACDHAARRYGVNTQQGDAQSIPINDASIDTIVSFETIEHVANPEKFLDECVRVLAPGGQLIISTPNRDIYHKDATKNPYHIRELNEKEFTAMLTTRFKSVSLYTQRLNSASWWSLRSFSSERTAWYRLRGYTRLKSLMQSVCCREIIDPSALERARKDPVKAIMTRQSKLSCLANPFAIRKRSELAKEIPIYLIAVANL